MYMLLSQRCVCIFPGANQPTSQRAARPTTDPGNHKKETEIKKKKHYYYYYYYFRAQ